VAVLNYPNYEYLHKMYNGWILMKSLKGKMWVVFVGIVLAIPISYAVLKSTRTSISNSVLTGHGDAVECVVFSNNGRLLLSGSSDQTVRLWDVQKGVLKTTLSGHSGGVRAVAFCQDDKWGISSGYDRTVKLWDLQKGTLKKTLTEKDIVYSLAASPDGKTLATSELKRIRIWNIETGSIERELKYVFGEVEMLLGKALALEYLPNGRSLIGVVIDITPAISMEGAFCEWDAKTGKLVRVVPIGFFYDDWPPERNDRAAGLACDGSIVAFWSGVRGGKEVRVWDTKEEKERFRLKGFETYVWSFAFSPENKILALASGDGSIRFIDTHAGTEKHKMIFEEKEIPFGISFSPDGNAFAAAMMDGTVRIWNIGSILSRK